MTTFDRPAAIRRALRDLVAERGFHGASMSAIAKSAGVATGTAYVHYASKEELVFATYLEIKREMGDEVAAAVTGETTTEGRYRQLWLAVYRYLSREPQRARFLTQLEGVALLRRCTSNGGGRGGPSHGDSGERRVRRDTRLVTDGRGVSAHDWHRGEIGRRRHRAQ